MLDTSVGFSIVISIIITTIIYFINRDKNSTEKQNKERINEAIITGMISFIVILFGKISLSSTSTSTVIVKTTDMKGGQCPF